jgi:hypothetical protein
LYGRGNVSRETEGDASDSTEEEEEEEELKARSPVASKPVQRETVYKSALSQQRSRVQMIREKIRAAMIIQQAYRVRACPSPLHYIDPVLLLGFCCWGFVDCDDPFASLGRSMCAQCVVQCPAFLSSDNVHTLLTANALSHDNMITRTLLPVLLAYLDVH